MHKYSSIAGFTFTYMHLADAFIQSDLQCIQAIHLYCQYVCSLGIDPTTLALLTQCSNHWATGTQDLTAYKNLTDSHANSHFESTGVRPLWSFFLCDTVLGIWLLSPDPFRLYVHKEDYLTLSPMLSSRSIWRRIKWVEHLQACD